MIDLQHKIKTLSEKILIGIAWHLPKKLVMWCAVRVGAHATTGKYSNQIVPDITIIDALQRWGSA